MPMTQNTQSPETPPPSFLRSPGPLLFCSAQRGSVNYYGQRKWQRRRRRLIALGLAHSEGLDDFSVHWDAPASQLATMGGVRF